MGGVVRTIFGGSTQKQTSTQQASNQLDPRMFDLYNQNVQRATAAADQLGPRQIAGLSPDFYAGRDQVYSTIGGTGQRAVVDAQGGARSGMEYSAPMIIGLGYDPTTGNAAQGNRADVRDVSGGSFLNANIGEYMNPYLNLVAGNTVNDMERARVIAQGKNANAATAAKAFGGSRQGVLEAETNRGYFDRLGSTLGSLYATGFDAASGLASQDLTRALQANLANQGADLSVLGLNTANQQQMNLANMDASNKADQFSADAMNRALMSNQAADLTAAQQRLAATGLLGQLGVTDQNMALQRAEALARFAAASQENQQAILDATRNLPIEQQALINAALGLNPGGGSGMVAESSGTMTGSGSSSNGILGGITGLFSGGKDSAISGLSGFFSASDKRVKEDIEKIEDPLAKIRELSGYAFNYKGSPDRTMGVMAQDVERVMPGALGMDGNGVKMVNYPAITGLLVEAVNELSKKRGK